MAPLGSGGARGRGRAATARAHAHYRDHQVPPIVLREYPLDLYCGSGAFGHIDRFHEDGLPVAALVLAAALRFAGSLGTSPRSGTRRAWPSSRTPHEWSRIATLDHRYYLYPGLFFQLCVPSSPLAPRVGSLRLHLGRLPAATLLGRRVIWRPAPWLRLSVRPERQPSSIALAAGRRTASSALRRLVPRRFSRRGVRGPRGPARRRPRGLLPSRLLASGVSGRAGRDDLVAGLALGAAAGVKFTGLLVVPAYSSPRPGAGPASAGRAPRGPGATIVLALSTPYALLAPPRLLPRGCSQLQLPLSRRPAETDLVGNALYYLRTIGWSLGPIGALLAILGLPIAAASPAVVASYLLFRGPRGRASRRRTSPGIASSFRLAVASLLAAAGFVGCPRPTSTPWLGGSGAGICFRRRPRSNTCGPSSRRARETPSSNGSTQACPGGSRVLTTVHELGLDRNRSEMIEDDGSECLEGASPGGRPRRLASLGRFAPSRAWRASGAESLALGGGGWGGTRVRTVEPGPPDRPVPCPSGRGQPVSPRSSDARHG